MGKRIRKKEIGLVYWVFSLLIFVSGCGKGQVELPDSKNFKSYWYDHGAEMSKYDLKMERYGEVRDAEQVMIYVTEPFSTLSQVKAEDPESENATPCLKLNALRRFVTGVYDYSLMMSVFAGINKKPEVFKITTSRQDWCGQSFLQFNNREEDWQIRRFSYFEKMGDQNKKLSKKATTEDGLWLLIRIHPSLLPLGEFEMIPGSMHLLLGSETARALKARATLSGVEGDGELQQYQLEYPTANRSLTIQFQKSAPHMITSWYEEMTVLKKGQKRVVSTRAKLTHAKMLPYWELKGKKDVGLRKALGLKSTF